MGFPAAKTLSYPPYTPPGAFFYLRGLRPSHTFPAVWTVCEPLTNARQRPFLFSSIEQAYPGGLQREVFAEALCSFGREKCGIRSETRRKSPVSGKGEKRQGREPARRTRYANSASCSRSTSGWNCTPNSRSPHSIASAVPSAARADTVSRGEGCVMR